MIRCQPILLSKMMLEERFLLFSEDRWICQSIFTFYRIARSRYIHSSDTSIEHPFGQQLINTNSFLKDERHEIYQWKVCD